MSTQPLDFSDLGAKPVSKPLDFSDLGAKPVISAPAASQPAPQRQSGAMERFAVRAFHLSDDIVQRPGAYLNPFSKEYWDKGKEERAQEKANPQEPSIVPQFAKQASADLGTGNIAGAAGDLIGPVMQTAAAVRPIFSGPAGPPSRITQTVKAVSAPVGKMALGMAEDIPVVRGALKGAKTFQDVPSQLRDIWSKAPAEAKADLAAKIQDHQESVQDLHQQLTDALAKLHDVPDYRVQPAEKAPQNLLDPAPAQATSKAGFNDATQTYSRPSKMGTSQGIQDMLAAAKSGESTTARVDTHKVAKTAIGQETATPAAEIYNEPMQEKTAQQIYAEKFLQKTVPKQSLLDQLKQWDQIRQIHAQLEDQLGKGQSEIQQWMAEHDQNAAGSKGAPKPTGGEAPQASEATVMSEGEADVPRVPISDSDQESLLMKSLKKYGFQHDPKTGKMVKVNSAKAGDD